MTAPTDLTVPVATLAAARRTVVEALRQLHLVYTERDEYWAQAVVKLNEANSLLGDALDPKNQLPF